MTELSYDIRVAPWARRHARALRNWGHDDHTSSLFLLRARDEPYDIEPQSLAIMLANGLENDLIGRFTWRRFAPYSAFTGIVINPFERKRRLGVPSLRASLEYIKERGFYYVYASVAVANIPSVLIHQDVGFVIERSDWRAVPPGVSFAHLVGLPTDVFTPFPPQLRYHRFFLQMSG